MYGAQWPVCRSWCQCHPLFTVQPSRQGFATSIPACLENLRDIRRTLSRLYVRLLRRYHSQFDRHIRADRRNFKSANECGRGQADRHPEAVARLPRSFASLPGNHLRRDLDSPTAATAAAHYDILPCSGCRELGIFDLLNLSIQL